jgi:RNA 2',3'-cyclic 3'-phosphodiesterase
MRLFVALDIDNAIRSRIAGFLDGVRGFTPDARWVRPESLHVTLKFIGERPDAAVESIKQALRAIGSTAIELNFRGYGFFPNPRAPRVFWIGIESGPALTSLASTIDQTLAGCAIPEEEHAFNPHLTLARRSGRSESSRGKKPTDSNRSFHRLQEKLAALPAPEFGRMMAREFFLFRSQLSPGGSKYTKLAAFTLR